MLPSSERLHSTRKFENVTLAADRQPSSALDGALRLEPPSRDLDRSMQLVGTALERLRFIGRLDEAATDFKKALS